MIPLLVFSKTIRKSLKKSWLAAIVALVLLLFMVGCENQMSTQRGVVSGLVLDDVGNRVTGAIITSHRSMLRAETDKNGYYEFTSLDVGSHRLTVERNGFYLASKTVEIGYGQVLGGINIIVENLPDMIKWQLSVREKNRVVIDVECSESMSVLAAWRLVNGARLQTMPTQAGLLHQIELAGLIPGAEYQVQIEGITPDGRKFYSDDGRFTTLHPLDLAGPPSVPENLRVRQSPQGPVLSWVYNGVDPVEGFRVYRGVNGGNLGVLFNEDYVFAAQNTLIDDGTEPGQLYRYALQAVDLEGNVSSMTTEVSLVTAGKIVRDLTWKNSGGPIRISGDITVPAGKTLTIEPGVNLVISASDEGNTGYRRDACEFIVEGTLLAEGTVDEPIRMVSGAAVPTRSDWDGIRLVSAAGQNQSVLKNVEIAGAQKGLALYNSEVIVENLVARYCQTGLGLHGLSGFSVAGVKAFDCETGLYAENSNECAINDLQVKKAVVGVTLLGNKNLVLKQFDIRDARKTAVKTGDRSGLILRNGVLHAYETGLDAGGAVSDYQYLTVDAVNGIVVNGAEPPVIRNCIVYNRQVPQTGYGIEDKTLGRSYPYNIIFNYLQPTFNCDQNGGPVQNSDPQFIGGSDFDYRLRPGSPALTASDRNGQIGAYGSAI